MPKTIELTVEIDVQRVSCPGVWLCQDGRVSLTVYALGTRYQTGLLPPIFPLAFKDVFYFRKRFQETCALNNICCLLKEETIYCELVQWCQSCATGECLVLAQYLGTLNDVLFPPNTCSNDGVDLLMRRCKEFPGILAPKIEIATKVRIDEVWSGEAPGPAAGARARACTCASVDGVRQKPVCHSAQYHRIKCPATGSPRREASITKSRSRSRSRSAGSKSLCSLREARVESKVQCTCPKTCDERERDGSLERNSFEENRFLLKSRYIEENRCDRSSLSNRMQAKNFEKMNTKPCVCEICKRYNELFHSDCPTS